MSRDELDPRRSRGAVHRASVIGAHRRLVDGAHPELTSARQDCLHDARLFHRYTCWTIAVRRAADSPAILVCIRP